MIPPKRNINDAGYSSGMTIFTAGENFHEFEHGLGREPELVTLVVDLGNGYHCDGLGSMSTLPNVKGTQYSWGGVIYGYNESHVRIWAPSKNGGALFSVQDGWGVQSNSFDVSYSGAFQVKVWSKVTNTHVKRFIVGRNDKGQEVDLPVTADIDNDLVFMTVKAIDGNNKGFSFPASGAVQNAHDRGEYGGVVYSYSTNKLRYWLPPLKQTNVNGPQGRLIYINDEYGGGHFQQGSLSAELAIHVWKSNTTC
ncbi:hypothetical protein FSP39_022193 [Pinctada imbricata]|uniref:Uncharacterized protein n=1 Tax=Pinctada imbricata TaxID=66713 RepID=A0AA89BTG6_PINIB|nr:hypothetical protein FSP39_022193 [Pinctada imbricata]